MALLVIGLAAASFAAPPLSAPAAPDLLYFERHLAADLNQRCATCHSDPEMADHFAFEPLAGADRGPLLRNFRSVLGFLDPDDPARSPLLRHALGMEGHPGGALYASTTRADYEALLHFAMGATLSNRPPEAILPKRILAKVGEQVRIDGSLSGDPEGAELGYRWELTERPTGSASRLDAGEGGGARMRPDQPGAYNVTLRVHDGALWSLPTTLLLLAQAPDAAVVPQAPAGTPEAKRPLVERRLDPQRLRRVRRLYLDLQWRSPTLPEIEEWYERTHEEMVDAFLGSEEAWSAWFEQQLYYLLLLDQFRPKEGRLVTLPARLAKGEIDAPRALEEIVRSQYFNARNPGNDTFVTVVLEQCLGLVVQQRENKLLLEAGKKMYDGYKTALFRDKGDSQADFVRIVFAQREFHRHFLGRMWKEFHGTPMEVKRLDAEAARLAEEPGAYRALLRGWLTGPEYLKGCDEARTKPEIPYVRALFVDTLGRTPVYEEMRNVRNAFLSLADPTPIRLVMGRVLLESPEARIPVTAVDPARFVREQFVRLFARLPEGGEEKAFVAALKEDPRVTPRVVLWTLLSSPEYQSY